MEVTFIEKNITEIYDSCLYLRKKTEERMPLPLSNHYAEPKYNAAFDRCIDVMVNMIRKYGPSLIDRQLPGDSTPDESDGNQHAIRIDAPGQETAA